MKPQKYSFVVCALVVGLAGCNQGGGSAVAPPGTGSATGKAGTGTGEAPKPQVSSIDNALKHEAYHYNGFEKQKPMTYKFARVQGEKAEEGTQVYELKNTDAKAALFEVKRTGSLEVLGTEQVEVRPDGIYLVSAAQGKPKSPVFQMPADLPVGKTWTYEFPLSGEDGKSMTLAGTAKVLSTENVSVQAGKYDAIVVSETAKLNKDGTTATVAMKTWYAKDVGIVKMKMELKDASGKIVTSTMELTGAGS